MFYQSSSSASQQCLINLLAVLHSNFDQSSSGVSHQCLINLIAVKHCWTIDQTLL
jgi:hypothetical protein